MPFRRLKDFERVARVVSLKRRHLRQLSLHLGIGGGALGGMPSPSRVTDP